MQPSIVIAYLKAAIAGMGRAAIAIGAMIALNLALDPGLLDAADPHRHTIVAWLQRAATLWSVMAAAPVAIMVLLAPWLCFRYAQWRYKGLDATAILPAQHASLSLALGRDEAFALVHRVLLDDRALYAVHADANAGNVLARAVPLRSRSSHFGIAVTADTRATPDRQRDRWPEPLLRVIDALRLNAPPRRLAAHVRAVANATTEVRIDARLATLLPAVDVCARNRRHVDALVEAIGAAARPLLAREREGQERAQLEQRLQDARLQLLRAQIEPHFLYNTLASVQYLIRNDPGAASTMVSALIDYLQSALPRMREGVSTLGDEVALARAYVDILRIRMGARLRVAIDVPATLGAHPFPPMMLLSLVENAIKHGLEPRPGGGSLSVTASCDERALVVTVTDDGAGFGASAGTGIGLRRHPANAAFAVRSGRAAEG